MNKEVKNEMNNEEFTIESFFLDANNVRVQMHAFLRDIANAFDLHGQELVFLFAIDHYEDVTVGLLSRELSVQQANVSKMMRALEDRNFIIKIKDQIDTRTHTIHLSGDAIELLDEVKQSIVKRYEASGVDVNFDVIKEGVIHMNRLVSIFNQGL